MSAACNGNNMTGSDVVSGAEERKYEYSSSHWKQIAEGRPSSSAWNKGKISHQHLLS